MEVEASLASGSPRSRTVVLFFPQDTFGGRGRARASFPCSLSRLLPELPHKPGVISGNFHCPPQKSPKEAQTKAGSWEPRRLTPDVVTGSRSLGPETSSGPGHIPG